MYIRLTVHRVKSEDRETYLRAMKEEAEDVQTKEPRARNYYLLQDQSDPNVFFIVAIFEDKAAHTEHINTPHLKGMLAFLQSRGIRPEQVGKWEATNIVPDDANWR